MGGMMPQVVNRREVDDVYDELVLDEPYDGWVHNDEARIRLNGQDRFLIASKTDVEFGTPADLLTE
jgi:hypothetical protein